MKMSNFILQYFPFFCRNNNCWESEKAGLCKSSLDQRRERGPETTFPKKHRSEKVPGKSECTAAISAEPILAARTWRQLTFAVNNQIVKAKK